VQGEKKTREGRRPAPTKLGKGVKQGARDGIKARASPKRTVPGERGRGNLENVRQPKEKRGVSEKRSWDVPRLSGMIALPNARPIRESRERVIKLRESAIQSGRGSPISNLRKIEKPGL